MEIEQSVWGFTEEGEAVILYTMRNSKGAEVQVTNIGAALVSVKVPDRNGEMADVVLGYDRWDSYLNDWAASGKTVGRFANRIARGMFSLDGKDYRLAQNNGPNALYGGVKGFANRWWQSRVETDRVVFSLVSEDGDQGYPGRLHVEVCYDWDDDDTLEITFFAKSEAPTIINLTNHAYFNLAGEGSGSVLGQTLRLNADSYLPCDRTQIPTGELAAVEGTPMDFRTWKPIGRDIDADDEQLGICRGYDHCFPVNGYEKGVLTDVAELYDEASGRVLTVATTQPGVHLYTGNWLEGNPMSKSGRYYENRYGVALECQNFPDAPNHPDFPPSRLDPDEVYEEHIVYRFGVR